MFSLLNYYQGNNRNEAGYYAYGLPTSDSDVKSYYPYLYGDKLAHARYKWEGGKDKIWYDKVNISEIYTTHIENKIRAEQKAPLRTHYGYDNEKRVAYGRIIDKSGNFSLYYTASEKLMFPVNKYPFIAFKYLP